MDKNSTVRPIFGRRRPCALVVINQRGAQRVSCWVRHADSSLHGIAHYGLIDRSTQGFGGNALRSDTPRQTRDKRIRA